ncbi:NTPase KAP [Spirosoma sp. HMF4905]|uniref:NTPase KAP n=1 Tax=Spirosoma arboris TaxID=2682092 RepID=A0A7K1SFC0_9BACT|nr:Qat anti-phage system ATPase QatA [Spirosoma arboris]MVM32443.1 NTPase KAP [Spirosoma arboris]
MILSDNETKVDLLNSEAIAQTIVKLIRERPERPITIGVHGDWGAGKSSVLEMIEAGLEPDKEIVLCIKFNGWRFQGFEDAKIALIEGIVSELIDKKSLWSKAKDEVIEIYERMDWLKAAKKAGGFLLTAFTGIPSPEVIGTFMSGLQAFADDPFKFATPENAKNLVEQANSILKPKEAGKNVPKEISEFRKSFDKLLKAAGIEQLVVLVDDLDRCLPDTAIETLEAIRLFIFTGKTAFVIAADEGMIEYAVRKHFPDFPDTSLNQTYTRNYLEKLIQVPFKIPILGETETKIYVTLLLVGAEIGECDEFNTLINIARERLRKPWENLPLDSVTIKTALGEKATKVKNALALSDQVGPILASGMKGNPRQIKRFLNTLLLRHLTAEARGFGSSINLPEMAKLMIAERFIPHLFEQVAVSAAQSSNGICKELGLLEALTQQATAENAPVQSIESNQKSFPKKKEKENQDNLQFDNILPLEWAASDIIKEWAKIKPSLANVDLRPYLFVAREKKDFFGTSSSLGHLTLLIDKLFGGRYAVQTLEPDIKALSERDALRIFEEMRSRILSNSNFDKEPEGIIGLTLVIKSHPELQDKLIELLESLPAQKLGPWVIKGWDGVVSGEAARRFDKLVSTWASSGSPFLKAASLNAQKVKRTN